MSRLLNAAAYYQSGRAGLLARFCRASMPFVPGRNRYDAGVNLSGRQETSASGTAKKRSRRIVRILCGARSTRCRSASLVLLRVTKTAQNDDVTSYECSVSSRATGWIFSRAGSL